MEWKQDDFIITDRQEDLDIDVIHGFLHQSYWAKGIPKATVEKSVRNSFCFGLYHNGEQAGFARVVSDRATFAYLADVFVLPEYRGRGLGKWLISCVMDHPELQGLRLWLLLTRDAHGLYEPYGFKAVENPERIMGIFKPEIYRDME